MSNLENKLKAILEERETLLMEINELHKALSQREERIIQISGSINTLQELINEENEINKNNEESECKSTKKE